VPDKRAAECAARGQFSEWALPTIGGEAAAQASSDRSASPNEREGNATLVRAADKRAPACYVS